MKEVKLFQCELCGVSYKDKQKCEQCEKSHVKPVKIVGRKFNNRPGYPSQVFVLMENGVSLTYKR